MKLCPRVGSSDHRKGPIRFGPDVVKGDYTHPALIFVVIQFFPFICYPLYRIYLE